MNGYFACFITYRVQQIEIINWLNKTVEIRRISCGFNGSTRRVRIISESGAVCKTEQEAVDLVAERLELEIEALNNKAEKLKRKLAEVRSHLAKEQY